MCACSSQPTPRRSPRCEATVEFRRSNNGREGKAKHGASATCWTTRGTALASPYDAAFTRMFPSRKSMMLSTAAGGGRDCFRVWSAACGVSTTRSQCSTGHRPVPVQYRRRRCQRQTAGPDRDFPPGPDCPPQVRGRRSAGWPTISCGRVRPPPINPRVSSLETHMQADHIGRLE